MSPGVIARLKRDETRVVEPWVLGRIIPHLEGSFHEAFPEAQGDAYDYFIPPTTPGGRLRNLRLRRAMKQKNLARALGVLREAVRRYEAGLSRPNARVRRRLEQIFT